MSNKFIGIYCRIGFRVERITRGRQNQRNFIKLQIENCSLKKSYVFISESTILMSALNMSL